jgi:carboxymethylenebutenolidase
MDGFGIRPTLNDMAKRLADGGYAVLLPDLYYRSGPSAPMDPKLVFGNPELRGKFMAYVQSLNRDRKIADASACVDFLLSRPEVKGDRLAATGYCLGGNVALTAAGGLPGKFAAVASFHGGRLATDDPESPHRFAKNIDARVYVAGAIQDEWFTDAHKRELEKSLADAGVKHLVETYPARHGFTMPDAPPYDRAAAERHWDALFQLLRETFGAGV